MRTAQVLLPFMNDAAQGNALVIQVIGQARTYTTSSCMQQQQYKHTCMSPWGIV